MVGLIFWALTHTTRREEASFCFEDFSPPCFFYYTSIMLCDKYFCFRNIFVCVVEFNVLEIKFICFQKLVYLLEICKNLTLLEILETLCNRGTYRREKERVVANFLHPLLLPSLFLSIPLHIPFYFYFCFGSIFVYLAACSLFL